MKPIIFNTEMVRAILGGRKTQTRRPVKRTDTGRVKAIGSSRNWHLDDPKAVTASPYQVGDVLYVRETWRPLYDDGIGAQGVQFRDFECLETGEEVYDFLDGTDRWRPSIHMPKWAARIFLKVTAVRLERVQDISDADAQSEGVERPVLAEGPLMNVGTPFEMKAHPMTGYYRDAFLSLYQSIYGNVDENPWVWVIEFERIKKPEAHT